jgi:hypothetical protein
VDGCCRCGFSHGRICERGIACAAVPVNHDRVIQIWDPTCAICTPCSFTSGKYFVSAIRHMYSSCTVVKNCLHWSEILFIARRSSTKYMHSVSQPHRKGIKCQMSNYQEMSSAPIYFL